MKYASVQDYKEITGKTEITEQQLEYASDMIDRLTYNRIRAKGFDGLSEYQQEMVKKATCYQASFLESYGQYLDAPISSYSAGSISVSFQQENIIDGMGVDSKAVRCLRNSGLMTRRL